MVTVRHVCTGDETKGITTLQASLLCIRLHTCIGTLFKKNSGDVSYYNLGIVVQLTHLMYRISKEVKDDLWENVGMAGVMEWLVDCNFVLDLSFSTDMPSLHP